MAKKKKKAAKKKKQRFHTLTVRLKPGDSEIIERLMKLTGHSQATKSLMYVMRSYGNLVIDLEKSERNFEKSEARNYDYKESSRQLTEALDSLKKLSK